MPDIPARWNDIYGRLSKVKKKKIKRAMADQIVKSRDFLGIFKPYPNNVLFQKKEKEAFRKLLR